MSNINIGMFNHVNVKNNNHTDKDTDVLFLHEKVKEYNNIITNYCSNKEDSCTNKKNKKTLSDIENILIQIIDSHNDTIQKINGLINIYENEDTNANENILNN
jgi:hypothetical protein